MLGPRHLKMCELTEKCCIRLQALTFLAPILLLFGYYFVSRCFWVSLSVCSSNLSYLILRYFQPCEHKLTSYKGRRVYEFSMGPVLSSNKPDTNAQSVAEIETGGNHFELIHLPKQGQSLGPACQSWGEKGRSGARLSTGTFAVPAAACHRGATDVGAHVAHGLFTLGPTAHVGVQPDTKDTRQARQAK